MSKIEEIRERANDWRANPSCTRDKRQVYVEDVDYLLSELDRLTAENAELKAALENEMEQNRWIPVKESLPPDDKSEFSSTEYEVVIKTPYDRYVTTACYVSAPVRGKRITRWKRNGIICTYVTHWRPHPEPPKGD